MTDLDPLTVCMYIILVSMIQISNDLHIISYPRLAIPIKTINNLLNPNPSLPIIVEMLGISHASGDTTWFSTELSYYLSLVPMEISTSDSMVTGRWQSGGF